MAINLGNPIKKTGLVRELVSWHSTIAGNPYSLGSTWFDLNKKVNAPITGGPVWDSAYGRPGGRQSASFATGKYADITAVPSSWPNGITLASWIRPSTTGRQDYFSRWGASTVFSFVLLSGVGTGYSFYINGSGGFPNATTGVAISAGTWSWVVATYDNANLKIYLDGVLKATTADAGGIVTSTSAAYIGKSGDSDSTCQMDDCMLLARPWSDSEVYQSYIEARRGWAGVLNFTRHDFITTPPAAPSGLAANPLYGGGAAASPLWGYVA